MVLPIPSWPLASRLSPLAGTLPHLPSVRSELWVYGDGKIVKASKDKKFKQYIISLGSFCRDETFHGEYVTNYTFEDHPCESDDCGVTTFATVRFDSVYLQAHIMIYPSMYQEWLDGEYKEIGKQMLHEFCHGYIEPIWKLFRWDVSESQTVFIHDTIERQVQRICYSLHLVLPNGWYLPNRLHGGRRRNGR